MPKTHERHRRSSYKKGDLVEYVGKDTLQRGVGVVLEEMPYDGFFYDKDDKSKTPSLSYVRVYWQNLGKEEVLHKARVRMIIEITKYKSDNKNAQGSRRSKKEEQKKD